jgi:transposase
MVSGRLITMESLNIAFIVLPYDLRDWVKDNDLAKFVLEAVELTDTSMAKVNHRGSGSAEYPPGMMLALLIYCYATGVFSSRKIERATYDSISVRYICANHHPDHDTVAKFRRNNPELIEECFAQVLALAGHMGLLNLGTICIDGTRIAGHADGNKNLTLEQLEEELKTLKEQARQRMQAAEQADKDDHNADGLLLPEELGSRSQREAKLTEAKAKLEERLERLRQQRKASMQRSRRQDDKPRGGRPSNPRTGEDKVRQDRARQKINPNDPDTHSMPVRKGGYVQGYNAQASVDAEGANLILSAHLTNAPNDRQQMEANLERIDPKHLRQTRNVCADKGYYKRRSLMDLEGTHKVRMIVPPTHQDYKEKARYAKDHPREVEKHYKEKLLRRLKTAQGKALYRKRNTVSEGTFATTKNAIGFNRFRLKGLHRAQIQWMLACLGHNCRKIAQSRA